MEVGGQVGGFSIFWRYFGVRLSRNWWNVPVRSNYSFFSNAKGGRFWPLCATVGTFGVPNTCVESSWGGFMGYLGTKMGGLANASFCGRSLINNIFTNLITFSSTIQTHLIATKENIASDTKKTCFWHEPRAIALCYLAELTRRHAIDVHVIQRHAI